MSSNRSNVVLICVDQWRGDCLGLDGHPAVQTPYLDELALEGTRFSRAYTATPTCIASRAGLYTGLSHARHGRIGYREGVPWRYPRTIASEFSRNGYQTQAIGKMHVYPERAHLGFDHVELHDGFLHFGRDRRRAGGLVDDYLFWLQSQLGPDADYADHGVDCNSYVARPWGKDESLHPTNWVTTRSIDFLRRRDPTRPFFLYMSFHRPHPPYDPPAWAFDLYRQMPLPPAPLGDWTDDLEPFAEPGRHDAAIPKAPEAVRARAQAGYYGHMTHIDHQIKRFLDALVEYHIGKNTVVCFTSDHGELLGDHGLWRKSLPYEGSARVPLILRGADACHVPKNQSVDAVVELRDIMPTLLDAAGIEPPADIDGKSLLPVVRNQTQSVREFLHGEHLALGQSVQWLTDGREKYIWFSKSGIEQLFDLQADPTESHDLARDRAQQQRVEHWRGKLIDVLRDRPEGCVRDGALVLGAKFEPLIPGVVPSEGIN